MMRKAGTLDRIVAGVLTVTLTGYVIPAANASTAPAVSAPVSTHAEIRGNVFGADGLSAIAGVSVKAAHMETRRIYTSESTSADGVYKLRDLPPGSYDLAVQTPQGLFAADALVEAKAGHRTTVSLAIRPTARQEGQPQEEEKPEGEKPEEAKPEEAAPEAEKPAEPEAQKPPRKSGGFWRSPAGAAIAIVAGAVVVGVAANSAVGDDEEDDEPLTQNSPD
jgi:hypothetical protein